MRPSIVSPSSTLISVLLVVALAAGGPIVGAGADIASAATFSVDSAGDESDPDPGDGVCDDGGGSCTLRAALEEANRLDGADTIRFEMDAVQTSIRPASALPNITSPLILDGYTEPGSREATAVVLATLIIELDGSNAGLGACGLVLDTGSGGTTIKGLVVNRFDGCGIRITGSDGNVISGNYIGTDVTGTVDLGNGFEGVEITNASSNNTVGGPTHARGNVIAGNGGDAGVVIEDPGSTGNTVSGNHIGTDVTGALPLGNSNCGVRIQNGATDNTVGGSSPEERNIVSSSGHDGIYITGPGTASNTVIGNYIGTDAAGMYSLGNSYDGIAINYGASYNRIGGPRAGERNVISGNEDAGIIIDDGHANAVVGNYIGMDATGATALGNGMNGVAIQNGASGNLIGGASGAWPGGECEGPCNLVSGNALTASICSLMSSATLSKATTLALTPRVRRPWETPFTG